MISDLFYLYEILQISPIYFKILVYLLDFDSLYYYLHYFVRARLSILGDKTEVILRQQLNEPLPLDTVRRDPPKKAFISNTGERVIVETSSSTQGPYLLVLKIYTKEPF